MSRLIAVLALVCCPCGLQAQAQMVRAAGMPLTDGALPPGSLTVRLVQGSFTGDLSGVTVELEIDGLAARRAPTGEHGRAEFAHLPIGPRVHARATVDGEQLESEPFSMPADSGVRLLLMTGVAGEPSASGLPVRDVPSPDRASGAGAVRLAVVSLTVLAFVIVGVQQWRRRRP